MIEDSKLITEYEATQFATKFLISQHYEPRISFKACDLSVNESSAIYCLVGEFTVPARSWLGRFTLPESADKYTFKMEIDAKQCRVLNYEIT